MWRVRNTGSCAWTGEFNWVKVEGDTILVEISGTPTVIPDAVPVPATQPGEVVAISAQLVLATGAELGSTQAASFQMHRQKLSRRQLPAVL